jgi:hypothetical protein
MEKKTFYCVVTEFDDNGKVKARQFSRECAKKPQDKEYVTALADIYEEWFDTGVETTARQGCRRILR